tara:strand:+ start:366 stop:557 length:192 start_codon:yes stop_codon:yes gene_type:complete
MADVKTIIVEQVASAIRRPTYQQECLKGLGLGKIGMKKTLENNKIVQGLITKVAHLVTVIEGN